jgi:endonuclease G, mitochondrial
VTGGSFLDRFACLSNAAPGFWLVESDRRVFACRALGEGGNTMIDNPQDGLHDGAAPVRVLAPTLTEGSIDPDALLSEQQQGAAERAKSYPGMLGDQLRVRRIATDAVDEARMRFTRAEDGLGLERLIGESDLVPVNFLEFGLRAARTVCRIQIRLPNGAMTGNATGFLVAPGLLLTNNHVLPNASLAMRSLAEFDFEDDINFNPRPTKLFRLRPEELFFTSRTLDFSFVAVSPLANDDTPLAPYGYLRLANDPNKLLKGEYVSIIQHPDGNTKQVALRENQVIWGDANFIHYETDTQPGSSGAPVFNDQWYVVALHHSGVPRTDGAGNWLKQDGTPLLAGEPDRLVDWTANEGVRISRIFRALGESSDSMAANTLARLQSTAGGPEVAPIFVPPRTMTGGGRTSMSPASALLSDTARMDSVHGGAIANSADLPPFEARIVTPPTSDAALYAHRAGYRENFLGQGASLSVPLPRTTEADQLLHYANFSIIFSLDRRLARLTAVNIDGATWQSIRRRRPDTWSYDPRIAVDAQAGRQLYDRTRYDYGHLVRRQDACSGGDPALAERDTFHLTNASPQDHALNIGPWNNLENHVLDTIRMTRSRVTVLTGPVFRDNDPIEHGIQIPQDFFKIAAYVDDEGNLAAAGWVQKQPQGRNRMEAAPQFLDRFPMWQLSIARIEDLTGLDLGPLVAVDSLATRRGLEAALGFEVVPIETPDDLIL